MMVVGIAPRIVPTNLDKKVTPQIVPGALNPAMAHLVKASYIEVANTSALLAEVVGETSIVTDEQGSKPLFSEPHGLLAGNDCFAGSRATRDHYASLTREKVENYHLLLR
jgi:hypothetical protein